MKKKIKTTRKLQNKYKKMYALEEKFVIKKNKNI